MVNSRIIDRTPSYQVWIRKYLLITHREVYIVDGKLYYCNRVHLYFYFVYLYFIHSSYDFVLDIAKQD